jgi:hypothetical protein
MCFLFEEKENMFKQRGTRSKERAVYKHLMAWSFRYCTGYCASCTDGSTEAKRK